ncbi:DUF1801 domain-containing protein [Quadrisphaera sp. INWT6]|uniref:DUF1801 domain-containing protein n=1 Tax=Quadrisphaera sp. INWT6 TaxID=2596917 RepID=UPI00189245A2|nr:DUF1801 domain-containing protein [Quadrisphaera sp. INWT6]MBF5082549.1 DUF1801 domain-containing protein [Quadrisphaera sp. INWT6]
MATPKTQRTGTDLAGHLDALPPARQPLARAVADVFARATGETAVLWGSIVGYGTTTTTSGGRTHEWPAVGFAVRGTRVAVYGLRSGPDAEELLARLGPHEAAVSCVYLRRLGGEVGGADVDVLTELVRLGHARSAVTGACQPGSPLLLDRVLSTTSMSPPPHAELR